MLQQDLQGVVNQSVVHSQQSSIVILLEQVPQQALRLLAPVATHRSEGADQLSDGHRLQPYLAGATHGGEEESLAAEDH